MSLLANLLLEASARIQFRHACHPSVHISVQCCKFKYCNPKNCFSALGIWSGLFIQDPDPDFLPIQDPGVKKAPDPGYTTLYVCWKFCKLFYLCICFRSVPVHCTSSATIFLYTEVHFISIGAKFGICDVVGLNGTLVEAKMRTFKCPKCEPNHREKKTLPSINRSIFSETNTPWGPRALIRSCGGVAQLLYIIQNIDNEEILCRAFRHTHCSLFCTWQKIFTVGKIRVEFLCRWLQLAQLAKGKKSRP